MGSLPEELAPVPTPAPNSSALRALIDNLPDAVVEQGEDGRICLIGGAVEALFGQTRELLIGARMNDLLVPEDRQTFAQLMSSAGVSTRLTGEFTLQQPGGARVPCEVSLQARQSRSRSRLISAVFRDISTRRALESDLRRAQRIAAERERLAIIGQLSAGVAHEVNNPLAYVKGNLCSMGEWVSDFQALLGAEGLPIQVKPMLEELGQMVLECLEGVDRIAAIVQAMKGMSRNRPNERIRFLPSRAVSEAVMVFKGAKQGDCSVACNLPELPEVVGSPGALSQVILNLLENGLDAMGGTGVLSLLGEVRNGKVRFSVTDSGPGIPALLHSHIYEPFFTTKEAGKGTGLGLYICHQLVEQMGGAIAYRTAPSGTTFTLDLPIAA